MVGDGDWHDFVGLHKLRQTLREVGSTSDDSLCACYCQDRECLNGADTVEQEGLSENCMKGLEFAEGRMFCNV